MWRNFFQQVEAADALGYDCAWVAMSHQSTEVQKRHAHPVVPHWQGEIGLNNDIFQLATRIFARTRRIEVGSAIMNLLCNGGPVARAEQVATFASLHGLDPAETRRLRLGFSGGRFDFMARTFGIGPRNVMEEVAWPALKGQVFAQACEIFLRLLDGQVVASADVPAVVLTRAHFRTDDHWHQVRSAARQLGIVDVDALTIPDFFSFEATKIVPQDWRRELVDLVLGSHDPDLQEQVNQVLPVKVFNLSITRPEIIDATHARMAAAYHRDGGPWRRDYMPRTVMVFVNAEPGLTDAERSAAAAREARAALSEYWKALEGTIDPAKVERAADNAVIGNPAEVAAQVAERFHPDDRLMLWFDFFNHDSDRVVRNMAAFREQVVPLVQERQAAASAAPA
ncbi:MAG: LLM class flavin-dependent oxidoreductase [Alphaproteobacteria bacterium]|nr:LLM class flavin-dependent oxidoreductase [Alphaproteobacteria bacterium]